MDEIEVESGKVEIQTELFNFGGLNWVIITTTYNLLDLDAFINFKKNHIPPQ